ncbi:MAG: glycosyltransferase family 2 protein [Paludibacteraceae bacterium]|nr:glycosyltransferase family 2 protein [Paludibacteraceae bacterium]
MNDKVGIVVVTYNRLALLKEVISSLRNQTYQNRDIIVINNGSTDDTKQWLDEQNDLIVLTQDNCGGAGGFFTGMKYAAENGYDYCWVMDDDVICNPDALEQLQNAYHLKDNIGFVCSQVRGINGAPMNTPQVDQRKSENGYAYFYDMIDRNMIRVLSSTFVSVFLSTAIIREVGLPYKEYFIWGDDAEYTMRISKKYVSYMVCDSIVLHKRAIQSDLSFYTETNDVRLRNYYYRFRNEGYNLFKYGNMSQLSKFVYFVKQYSKVLSLFLKGDTKRASILCKATSSLISFKPILEHPSK